ncbi:MAG: winged helix-turn-helix domain-containing protein [Candidatus Methylomirabilis sp.]|nr:winged helix-turn-helix domain-containing protein [Deltaproteobacteria bacterium]
MIADRRRRALALLDAGLSLNEAARRIGCAPSSVMRWRNERRKRGERVFEVRFSPGRPPKLGRRELRRLERLLLKGAAACGWTTDLWTTRRIAELIEREFGVSHHPDHVGRVLAKLGWSPQKPERRALERDEARIERWKREDWPRIKKKPRGWARISSS